MLYFSKTKVLLIFLAIFFASFFALPNVFNQGQLNSFPSFVPSQKVNLGLDLQGGSHLLLEVDTEEIIKERIETLSFDLRKLLKKNDISTVNLKVLDDSIVFSAAELSELTIREIEDLSISNTQNILQLSSKSNLVVEDNNGSISINFTDEFVKQAVSNAVNQSLEIVRRRIDELGTKEPSIQRQGASRIIIQLPGLDDPERIKSLLGQTAKLTFQLVDQTTSYDPNNPKKIPIGSEALESDEIEGYKYIIKKRIMVGGENLVDAQPGFDPQTNEPIVSFRFDRIGAKKFGRATQDNVGKPFAIVLDNKVISAPVIREAILGGSGQISGGFDAEEANDLAILLRAGALPAPVNIIEERIVGPSLGADSVRRGTNSVLLGLALIIVFMFVYYKLSGLIANFALIWNILLVLSVLASLGATLTLPGIAALILTVGMSIDANVIIFERIREELRKGKSVRSAVDGGYNRALTTIIDANVTTLIAALVLYQFGTGPIRGFATVLFWGIVISMFTAIFVTRTIFNSFVDRKGLKKLSI